MVVCRLVVTAGDNHELEAIRYGVINMILYHGLPYFRC